MWSVYYEKYSKGKKSSIGSTPLDSKQKVSDWVKKNPMIRSNSTVKLTNLLTNKSIKTKASKLYYLREVM